MTKRSARPTILAIALVGAAIAASPARAQSPAPGQPAAATPGAVVVMGAVEAFWSSDQYAKIAGYVSEVRRDIGDPVKKGDVLALLDVPEAVQSLAQARAVLVAKQQMRKAAEAAIIQSQQALAVAKSQLEGYAAALSLADVTRKRQEELLAGNAATPQRLDDARAQAQVAQANVAMGDARVTAAEADIKAAEAGRDVAAAQVDVADAQVREAEALLEYTRIVAPFDGVVTRRWASPGDLVQAATAGRTTPLFTIQQLDTVRVFGDVPETQAAGVSVGADASVRLYGPGGQVVKGKVTRVATAIDPATRTMRAEIDLPNADGALRPGMYAQVTIELAPPDPRRPEAGK